MRIDFAAIQRHMQSPGHEQSKKAQAKARVRHAIGQTRGGLEGDPDAEYTEQADQE